MTYVPRPKPAPRPCAGDCGVVIQPRSTHHRFCSERCKTRTRKRPRQVGVYSPERYRAQMADPRQAEIRRRSNRKNKRRSREWLATYKIERGCVDCGYREHAAALHLDHEGPKRAAISELRSSVRRMLEEIEAGQCVVRCANCHAVKTWAEKNGLQHPAEAETA